MRLPLSRIALTLLRLAVPAAHALDLDSDGLSDVWQAAYPTAGAAEADPDGDGATNLAESLAGTNPFDPTSRIVASAPETDAAGNTLLRWSGVTGKRYRIDSSTDLATWTLGTALLTADQSPRLVRAAGATSRARQFWRVTALDHDTDGDSFNDWEEAQLGSDPASAGIPLRSRFVPFGLCFGGLPAAQQIAHCQARGFTGMAVVADNPSTLSAFADHSEVASGLFRIHAGFRWVNYDTPISGGSLATLEAQLTQLARLRAALWLAVDSGDRLESTLSAGAATIRAVHDRCLAHGVQLVLYPHGGALLDDAEAALAMRNRVGRPEIKITLHLCHEIMAGNGHRITKVIAAVAPHLALASVSGSTVAVNENDNWASQIKPLDRGTYDVRPYLQALAIHGYTGPMTLMTYNLGDPGATPNHDPVGPDHLTRSLDRWTTLIEPAFLSK